MPPYTPNQYQYYPKPGYPKGYSALSAINGFTFEISAENKRVAFESTENMKALAKSQLPNEADKPGDLKELFQLFPALKAKGDRKARRQLSEDARNVIAKMAAEIERSKVSKLGERCFGVLLKHGDPDLDVQRYGDKANEKGLIAENKKIADIILNGTPEDRGKLVEKKVLEAMKFIDVFAQCKFTDEYIIKNYEALFEAQDVMSNAQAFLALSESTDPKKRIVVSPEIKEALKLMEFQSTKTDIPFQRARLIANANYELVDYTYLCTASRTEMECLDKFLGNGDNSTCSLNQYDLYTPMDMYRDEFSIANGINLADVITDEFAKEPEKPMVKCVDKLNDPKTAQFSREYDFTGTVGLQQGYAMAFTDTKAVCYRMNFSGKVTKAEPTDILNDMPNELEASLNLLKNANKGFFIGSKEFDTGLKAMSKLSKDMKNMGFPRVADDNMKKQLEDTIEACRGYIQKKNPDDEYDLINFKNTREKIRYLAMEQAIATCERQLKMMDLQKEALTIQANVIANQNKKAQEQNEPKLDEQHLGGREAQTWKHVVPDTRKMTADQFKEYLQSAANLDNGKLVTDAMGKKDCAPEDYYKAVTQELEAQFAKRMLKQLESANDPQQVLNDLKETYNLWATGLGEYVMKNTDQDALAKFCETHDMGSLEANALSSAHQKLSASGVDEYLNEIQAQNNNPEAEEQKIEQVPEMANENPENEMAGAQFKMG